MNNYQWTEIWMQTLGWTLLHSVWQAALIFGLLKLFMFVVRHKGPAVKHNAAVVAMIILLATCIFTFINRTESGTSEAPAIFTNQAASTYSSSIAYETVTPFLATVTGWLSQHIPWLVQGWLLGFALFILRIGFAIWYTRSLRNHSTEVGEWCKERVRILSEQLRLSRVVRVAEANISSPLVIGYLKPIILFPIGLQTGLSHEQIETILIHELSHIQRHDFVVHLFQAVMEAIFFFNPFVWAISAIVDTEREHCCDDAVLAHGSEPLTYAKTLAQLEEKRMALPLAIGFATNRNILFDRIKRIMEKSVKKDSGRARVLPITLILLGVMCASWLSIQRTTPETTPEKGVNDFIEIATDTAGNPTKAKVSRYEKSKVTRWNENGEPQEEVTEVYEGDVDMREALADFDFPPMPDFPDAPSVPGMPFLPSGGHTGLLFPPPSLHFSFDSIPGPHRYSFNEDEWENFEKEFTTQMKEQFGDFFEKNQEEIEAMIEAARSKSLAYEAYRESIDAYDEAMEAKLRAMEAELEAHTRGLERHSPDMNHRDRDMERQEAMMKHQEENMKRMEERMKIQEQEMKEMERDMRAFESALREQLIADGYLKKGEAVNEIQMNDNGEMVVNGVKLKKEHRQKYHDLKNKYMKKKKHHHQQED